MAWLGPVISRKNASRVVLRSVSLLLLFGAFALWQRVPRHIGVPPPQRPGLREQPFLTEAVESLQDEVVPRQLTAVTCPANHTCTAPAEKIDLIMVDKKYLRVEGCPIEDTVCLKEEYTWHLVLYVAGMLYMFVALAIVCDEFFVPSLEAFVKHYGIDMDIAGATFMAAGGSMPELFTSFIGTFNKSDVGFAAIVGSAVFNVLFVIGVCALALPYPVPLNWWPVFRDCMYYCIGLLAVYIFFGVNSPNEIQTGEALILLLLYVGYCTLMCFSFRLEKFFKWKLQGVVVTKAGDVADEAQNGPGSGRRGSLTDAETNMKLPSTFRTGILQILTQNRHLSETAGVAAVTQIKGNLEETWQKLDKDQNNVLDEQELKELLKMLGVAEGSANIDSALQGLNRTGGGKISKAEFTKWYIASEARIEIEARHVFECFDRDHSGFIEVEEMEELLKQLGHNPTAADMRDAMKQMQSVKDEDEEEGGEPEKAKLGEEKKGEQGPREAANAESDQGKEVIAARSSANMPNKVGFVQFEKWYKTSLFWERQVKKQQSEADASEQQFTIEPPEEPTTGNLIWFVLTYPLCAAMFCTMPDVRRPKNEGRVCLAFFEFGLSLLWIAFFSFCLVDWTVVTSNTLAVPVPVAGLTVLAAGTSIPDLLSSYIVAKRGEADMALSSSIGSNIFDILVGLPLPWLLYNLINGETVSVKTKSLKFSLCVLILMLVLVIVAIAIMRWKMKKELGFLMFFFYAVFMTQQLIQDLGDMPIDF